MNVDREVLKKLDDISNSVSLGTFNSAPDICEAIRASTVAIVDGLAGIGEQLNEILEVLKSQKGQDQ